MFDVLLGSIWYLCFLLSFSFTCPLLFMMIFINPLFGCLVNEVQEINLFHLVFF